MYGQQIVPIYIVCDESSSMSGDGIDEVNRVTTSVHRAIAGDPVIDMKMRVGIIAFNDLPKVLLPLTQLSNVVQIPGCVAAAQAHYGPVFRLLESEIESDFIRFMSLENVQVYRPVVFFLSTGRPVDEGWRTDYANLIREDFRFRPHIVAFGVGESDSHVLAEISTVIDSADYYWLKNSDGTDPVGTLKNFLSGLVAGRVFTDETWRTREWPII
jgi:uncharacterized protein YegL